MKDSLKCYETLDLHPGASAEQVRRAYVRLTQVWHPERFPDNPVLRAKAVERMREIDAAYKSIRGFLPELERLERGLAAPDARPVRSNASQPLSDEPGFPLPYLIGALVLLMILLMLLAALFVVLNGRSRGAHVPLG